MPLAPALPPGAAPPCAPSGGTARRAYPIAAARASMPPSFRTGAPGPLIRTGPYSSPVSCARVPSDTSQGVAGGTDNALGMAMAGGWALNSLSLAAIIAASLALYDATIIVLCLFVGLRLSFYCMRCLRYGSMPRYVVADRGLR